MRHEVERAAAEAAERRDRALRDGGDRWRARGVVHTPAEVARFVVARVDRALVGIGCAHGIADGRVALLDLACGPGAFLAAALAHGGHRPSVPRACVGLDVDEAALAAARAVLSDEIAHRGWPLSLRCADTLAELSPLGALEPDTVVAIVGNPPWSGRTANRAAGEVARWLEDFRRDHRGERLRERKIGVLSDDYVRFFRWAAEVARRAPAGAVLGLVTNASFLDGPVHRGMRGALARWFDGIDVIDLGGSALVARRRGRDENLFGVRPGAAVTIAWRAEERVRTLAEVRGTRIAGRREDKLAALARLDDEVLGPVQCVAPTFAFRAAPAVPDVYASWPSLADAMPFHREGVQTNRDAVAIDANRDRLLDRLSAFARGERRDDLAQALAPLAHYDPARARRAVAAALEADPDGRRGIAVRAIAYRPGDVRWLAPIPRLCHRPRPDLLAAIRDGETVLLSARKDRGDRRWACFGAAAHVPDNCWLSTRSSCRTRAFPKRNPAGMPNLSPDVAERFGDGIDVDTFMAYALAVISAPRYRAAFDPWLHADYPRIPPPPSAEALRRVADAGRSIADAFRRPFTGDMEVEVGHARVCSDALAHAIARADEAVAAIVRLD